MGDRIRDALANNGTSMGSWLCLTSPLAAEFMAAAGFPWLTVDTEHSAVDMEVIAHMFRAIEARGAVPLARAWNDHPTTIARLLDAGAAGLVIPHVSTPEQAERIAKSMRFPPVGTRSSGAGRCLSLMPDYVKVFNDRVLCIPQIEDMVGINNAEEIAKIDGIDIGFLGPGDLSYDMGVKPGDPSHEAALQKFRESFERVGKPSGIPVLTAEDGIKRRDQGFRFISVQTDMHCLKKEAEETWRKIN
jgi:2-keto-3-deoxy-L-rhamnonate aldolase RhmA